MSIFGNCGSLKLPSLLCHIAREYVIKHVILHKLIQSDFNDGRLKFFSLHSCFADFTNAEDSLPMRLIST